MPTAHSLGTVVGMSIHDADSSHSHDAPGSPEFKDLGLSSSSSDEFSELGFTEQTPSSVTEVWKDVHNDFMTESSLRSVFGRSSHDGCG